MVAGNSESHPRPQADDRPHSRQTASGDAQASFDVGADGDLCGCVCEWLGL